MEKKEKVFITSKFGLPLLLLICTCKYKIFPQLVLHLELAQMLRVYFPVTHPCCVEYKLKCNIYIYIYIYIYIIQAHTTLYVYNYIRIQFQRHVSAKFVGPSSRLSKDQPEDSPTNWVETCPWNYNLMQCEHKINP